MTEILFTLVFPLVLLLILIIIFISGIFKEKAKREFMSCDDFIKDWLKDHGQAHKVDEQFAKMKKDPSGKLYMPITYEGAKIFIKLGLTPNQVSLMGLILSFFIFWGVIMASVGHTLDLITQQPLYGSWFMALAVLVLYTGISDGIDGAIARLLDIKSKTGAWLDNIIDRVSDILTLVCFVPTSLLIYPSYGLDFTWMVWTNIFLIFIYEYMRARHEGLGLHETKPFIGERITRVLVSVTFFAIYGVSSLTVLLTNLVNPSATIWNSSHMWVITWSMLIYQISILVIMVLSMILFAKYIWKNLKKIEKVNIE
ncbi:MAG: CDP-alcohol phosphatidyltransferase family protein [Candidatus Lokiarchaeota archaeon]|nr:CDP-alcohol phosphatidyltransferase family protein [Candidatus Lokiarchaeota archaeon]